MPDPSDISGRKLDHIRLCAEEDVGFRSKTTLLEEVELVHEALPELALADVDLSTELCGVKLKVPLVIAAMTGGTAEAGPINRDLARVAEEFGVGFGFGSMRPLLVRGQREGYEVRDVAPNTLILGNIGMVQARETPTATLRELLDRAGCNALCVHLNPAMEVVQPEGDDDFRHGLDTLARLHGELGVPLVVKETGCGLSRRTAQRLVKLGVEWVDVSGAGGTSWVGVEARRADALTSGARLQQRLGARFWDWGIPTAASVAQLNGLGLGIIATGGVSDGLDVARVLALGARAAGIARPFLKAQRQGLDSLREAVGTVIAELRVAMLLTGSASPAALAEVPLVLGPRLLRWVPPGSALRSRLLDQGTPDGKLGG